MQGQGQGQYEFSPAQNAVIAKLASRMRLAAIAQLVFAGLDILGSCKIQTTDGTSTASGTAPFAIVLVVCGALTLSAASSFSRIVTTQGWDMQNLMMAVQSYSRALLIQFISYIVGLVLSILLLLLLLVLLLFFAAFLYSLTKS